METLELQEEWCGRQDKRPHPSLLSQPLESVNTLPYMAKRIKVADGIKVTIQLTLKQRDYSGLSDNPGPGVITVSCDVQEAGRRPAQGDSSVRKTWPHMLTLKTEEESQQPRDVGTLQKLERAKKWILPRVFKKKCNSANTLT